ncbi:MAG: peptidyl-prolyl cis-trans isomerase [Candidatus Eisenbacteria bacterium]
MKRTWILATLGLTMIALAAGCGGGDADKVVVRLTDTEGAVAPRELTVGYVNDRLDRMPPHLVPDIPGDEGKRTFIDEIIRKELLVIKGYRLGIQNEPTVEQMVGLSADDKANRMFIQEMVYDPAEPSREDVELYNQRRETTFQLQQIIVQTEEQAWDAYRRIMDDGEGFGEVAKEVSFAHSAVEGGKMAPKLWPDLHPVVSMTLLDYEIGDTTEPIEMGGTYHIYQVVGKKVPETKPLAEEQFTNIETECRIFQRTMGEYELNVSMMADADLRYNDPALAIAVERIAAGVRAIIPENIAEMNTEERMEIARMKVVPDFSEDEMAMNFVTYNVGREERAWTLADFRAVVDETPGIEGPKVEDAYGLGLFVWRKAREELIAHEIERRGYMDTEELAEYVDQRREEFIVNITYQREVNEKAEEPGGQEVRDYFRSHREDYMEPARVDLRQIIVPTEADANMIIQRISSGDATFEEMVVKYSIDEWSKPRGGLIPNYAQGERKLSYLQDVVFGLEIDRLSDPFSAPGGFAVVKVLATYPSRLFEFSEVGELVVSGMTERKKEARLLELLDEVRATVEIEWFEENLARVKDTAEAKLEKDAYRIVATS